MVNSVARQLTYANTGDQLPTTQQSVTWTFNDQNSGSQGTGGALSAVGRFGSTTRMRMMPQRWTIAAT